MTKVETATLIISGLALIVSAFSWLETRAARQLSRATSRAVLRLGPARMLKIMRGGGELNLDLENAGHALAKNVSLYHQTLTILGEEDRKRHGKLYYKCEQTDELPLIAPGKAYTHVIIFELPPEQLMDKWPTIVGCSVRVAYTDDATGEQFQETQFFTAAVTGNEIITKEMVPGGIPTPHLLDGWSAVTNLDSGKKPKP